MTGSGIPVTGSGIAQTAPRLWIQLARSGLSEVEITMLHRVYQQSLVLFTGRTRACGKPFIDHLVGTASVVATASKDVDVIGAALLHAAYTHNVFDDLGRGATRRRRAALRRLVGAPIEAHVHRYTVEPWDIHRLRALLAAASDPALRALVLLRVGNEVDEQLDGAMSLDPRRDGPMHDPAGVDAHAALARHYGFGRIATLLETVTVEARALSGIAPALRPDTSESDMMLPRWARPTLRRRARRILGRARRRVHR